MDMIDRMFDDTLWIYTAIAGSLAGAFFLAYFKDTRAGLWCYAKLDLFLDYLVQRWGLTWFEQPTDAWRKKYPFVTKKIDELETRINQLESDSHPCKELHEFEVWPELDSRIKKLENPEWEEFKEEK
jgi:hypothetical protein